MNEGNDTTRSDNTERLVYSVPEVAQLLGISRTSAYALVRTGVIKSVSLGGRIVVPRQVIHDLLDLGEAG